MELMCGNPDVFMYYKVNRSDCFICVVTFLKKCLDKSRLIVSVHRECRCSGVFVASEVVTSKLNSKKQTKYLQSFMNLHLQHFLENFTISDLTLNGLYVVFYCSLRHL